MAWFTRFTRFGDVHFVYSQEQNNSCGIACVLMCVFKLNKLVPGRQALLYERRIYDVYGAVSGATYDGSAYTYTNHLARTLNRLNCGAWEEKLVGPVKVPKAIVNSTGVDPVGLGPLASVVRSRDPIIVLVNWTGGGGHFVVTDTVNKTGGKLYASICDPWDGDVHVHEFALNKAFSYVGAPMPFSWDLGGTRHDYSSGGGPGALNGWVVRRIGNARPPGRTESGFHVVRAGDTLSRIAEIYYGDPNEWPRIHRANKADVPNPDLIRTGQRLVIPPEIT